MLVNYILNVNYGLVCGRNKWSSDCFSCKAVDETKSSTNLGVSGLTFAAALLLGGPSVTHKAGEGGSRDRADSIKSKGFLSEMPDYSLRTWVTSVSTEAIGWHGLQSFPVAKFHPILISSWIITRAPSMKFMDILSQAGYTVLGLCYHTEHNLKSDVRLIPKVPLR